MNKLDFFIDMDDTITISSKRICEMYNSSFYQLDPYFKPADWTKVNKWNYQDECPLANGEIEYMFNSKKFFDGLEFFSNAKEVLEKLKNKYNLIIVSIGSYQNLTWKSDWLHKNLPFCDAILLRNDMVKMDKSKVKMMNGLFLDDHESNLFSSDARYKYCFGEIKDWNKNWTENRLFNWLEVEKQFLG